MRDFKNIVLRVLSIILLVVGLILVFNKWSTGQLVKHNQEHAATSLTRGAIKKNQKKKGDYNFKHVKSLDLAGAAQGTIHQTSGAIGLLAIPGVNMHLPVMKGLSQTSMSTGGGTMRPHERMGKGNYALAGHYMTENGILFSPLENVQKGQLVYLTNLKHVYTYKIYMKKVVSPYSTWLVNNTKKPIVTLITCADGGKNRWAIRGKLIKTQKYNKRTRGTFSY